MLPGEPIAIVGMACRFPGGANHPGAFWHLLTTATDAITEVPEGRWNAARFHHANAAAPGRMVTRWGGFVEHAEAFDAAFFGIAPREAACMDPQHRWLLETVWEAIEDAGLPPARLAATRTGVFIGISHSDYPSLHRRDSSSIDRYTNIGSALSIAANRLSYLLDLRGPSLAVDTACSSSLVALHLAARSLWSHECDYAIVGGANALLTPEGSIGFSQARMLSPRGRCRAFDAGADGYVRSEGAAAILLMPLSRTRELNVAARAQLVATVSNQDGHSSSLTVPNQEAQEAMLREALQMAAAAPGDVVYAEAHGTGTPVGDPIEARALAAAFTDGRAASDPLLIGSVKTNIGHLEPASGLAGLIKAVLVLEHGTIPPNLHFETPNPLLPLDRVRIPTRLTPLPSARGRTPLVAVNSFGFGGANAHALLAAAPEAAHAHAEPSSGSACILPVSARSPAALAEYARAYADSIDLPADETVSLRDLCAAAALGKAHHPLRRAFVADSLPDLKSQLRASSAAPGEPAHASVRPKIAFIFSGQGPQWWAMGRQLYQRERVVREMWERCDATCRTLGGIDLLDALLADESSSRLDRTEVAQPALFALQAGLVELWRSWGIEADAVLGHSVGEAAAAWTAGIFDLDSILRIVLTRSRWQSTTHGRGRMLAAGIPVDDARVWEQRFAGRVSVAAINAPRQVTFAGDGHALEEIATALAASQVFHRFLSTAYAFHSAQMDPIADGLRLELQGTAGAAARRTMVSTVTGDAVRGDEMDAAYWWRNVREPVRFADGVSRLLDSGCTTLLEIGPHPVMASALAEIVLTAKSTAVSIASLRRNEDESRTMRLGLAELYRRGAEVRWEALYARPSRAIRLPAYPWQRQHLWHEYPDAPRELRKAPSHPLLGDRQPHPQPTWTGRLDARLTPWLTDHRIAGSAVVPAAAYLEMAAAAVRELLGESTLFLEDIRFHHLLFLPDERPVPTCVRLDPSASSFQVLSARPDAPGQWEVQVEGLYRLGRVRVPPAVDLDSLQTHCSEPRDPQALYRDLAGIGQVYGPTFQNLASLQRHAEESVLAKIAGNGDREWPDYLLFPPALDSCFHSSFALRRPQDRRAVVIVSLRQLRIFRPLPAETWCHLRIVEHHDQTHLGDLTLCDSSGAVAAQLDGLLLRAIDSDARAGHGERTLYHFTWEMSPLAVVGPQAGSQPVLVFAAGDLSVASLAEALDTRHHPATFVVDNAAGVTECADVAGAISVDTRTAGWADGLWATLSARGPLPSRVLYLWGWDRDDSCAPFLSLVQARLALPGRDEPARWVVATLAAQAVGEDERLSPMRAGLWGFVRTAQTEQPQWRMSLVDCAPLTPAALTDALIDELVAADIEPEVAIRDDGRHVRRLRQLQIADVETAASSPPAYALEIEHVGRADSLQFRGRARVAPAAGEVEIEVAAAGLNFRDVMKALGIYPLGPDERTTFGDELSGHIARVGFGVRTLRAGDRVAGFAPAGGAFASHVTVNAAAVWAIPEHISLVEAASIPVVYGTAFHALCTLARLRRGETVLVHAAAGGVGLAALQLAKQIGAVIFATAGSEEKRERLRSLGVTKVMDSRTLDFADEVLQATGGRGVDVVLNSLAGAFQHKSLSVCAPHGRFVEIGKRDLFENRALPVAAFQRSLSFFAFDLTSVLAARGPDERALRRFLSRSFVRGGLQPIAHTTCAAADAVSAFRRMQAAQHIGKIVLTFDRDAAPEVPGEFWPRPDGTYLVTGGLSGFGLATARWLAERGARHLALVSRRGRASAQDAPLLDELRHRGVSIHTCAADVADASAVADVLTRLRASAPPLRGVFHSAMVLRDRFLADMTSDDLAAVLAPKADGARHLDQQTRGLPLDCFVLFSSISSIIGAPGHANYAAANAVLDAIAHARRAEGLPATSINWGQLAGVGVAAEHAEIGRYLDGIGVGALPVREALAMLPRLIASGETQIGAMDVDWAKLSRASTKFSSSPVFRDLAKDAVPIGLHHEGAAGWRDLVRSLPPDEALAAVGDVLVAQIAATLGTAPADIDRGGALSGMDSLMAVELKVRIEDHSGCELPIDVINAEATIAQLAGRVLKQMIAVAEPLPTSATIAMGGGTSDQIAAPLLRKESAPLLDLVRAGQLPPLTAAALMPWPITLFERTGVSPEVFFQHMPRGVSLDLIMETPLGPVGLLMLPMTTSQVTPGEPSLLPNLLEGIAHASACGARCVALTGLIPSATQQGVLVRGACDGRSDLAAPTTGHATTVAAVVLNLAAILNAAGRGIEGETVLFYGVGSIGAGALRLMLDVMPHPAELLLFDPYRDAAYFAELDTDIRRQSGYTGPIRVVAASGGRGADVSAASVIVGATNVGNVLDVSRLTPGTLVVDDSSPHCLNGLDAFARVGQDRDILFTEGGFVSARAPMPRIAHVPPSMTSMIPLELPRLMFSMFDPLTITACVLSALISARRPDLPPTIGPIGRHDVRQHWIALGELGFSAAALNYEGRLVDPSAVTAFREQFGRRGHAAPRGAAS